MEKIVFIIVFLFVSATSQAEIPENMPQSIYDQIIQQVIQDKGYLDMSAVQEGIAQWQLQQPLPPTDGTLVETGNCTTCSADTQGTAAQFKKPRNVRVRARRHANGKYPSVLKIRWLKPLKLKPSLRRQYKVSHYLIYISKDGQSYEVLKKKARYFKSGKLKRIQRIKFKDRTTGTYAVQVQAVYKLKTVVAKSAQKSINKGASTGYISPWSPSNSFETQSKYTTVGQYTGAIQSCLNNNGFADSTLLTAVDPSIDCTGYNLQNADIDLMANLVNIRSIILKDNPAITDISALANLNYLEYLDLSNNPSIILPDFSLFSELTTLKLANMGLTTVPDLSNNDLLTTLDLNDNAIISGFDLLPSALNLLEVKGSGSSYCQINSIPAESIVVSADNLNLSDCVAITGLKFIGVDGGVFPNATQDISAFTGDIGTHKLCGLNITNTNLERLDGMVPIEVDFHLNNNNLHYVQPLLDVTNNVIPMARFASINSNNLFCSNRNELAEYSGTTSTASSQTIINKSAGGSNCGPIPAMASYYQIPSQCIPDPTPLVSMDVYEDINTQRRNITWAIDPNFDYGLWGVTYFKIQGLSNEVVVYERNIALDAEFSLVQNSFEPNVYTIRACTPQQCGDAITTSAPFSQGLSRVTDLTINWLNLQGNSKDYKFSFNYPSNLPIGLSWESSVMTHLDVNSNSVTKISGSDTVKYGAVSIESIQGDSYVEFQNINLNNQSTVIGLSDCQQTTCQVNQNSAFIDYGIQMSGGNFRVYENNDPKMMDDGSYFAPYNSENDVFRVLVIDGVIKYLKNNEVIYTSQKSPGFPLVVGASLSKIGDSLTNISLVSTGSNNTSNGGYPTYFEIHSDFTDTNGETLIETIPQSHGNQTDGWFSNLKNYNPAVYGNKFMVYACNGLLGCGVPASIIVRNPVTSADLNKPLWDNVYASGSKIILNWHVLDETNIDYFEVYEEKPVTLANQSFRPGTTGQSHDNTLYYLDVNDVKLETPNSYSIKLTRQAIGIDYHFVMRSCHRDRVNGDVCSLDSFEKRINQTRSDISNRSPTPPNHPAWYSYGLDPKYGLAWDISTTTPSSYTKPDYFYLTNTSGNTTCEHEEFTVSYADKSAGDTSWTVLSDCSDVGSSSTWTIKSCLNGLGCSGNVEINITNAAQNVTAPPITDLTNSPVVGGPGDVMPGMWWNSSLPGQGWHFYWASELRYNSNFNNPTTNSKYGKTYDLVGYWFAFQEIQGVWTPVWFEARLKQVIGTPTGAPNYPYEGYFQGDIFYHNKSLGSIEKVDVGNIQLLFGSNNQHATLIINPDNTSIFSQSTGATDIAPYTLGPNGSYKLDIQDFTIGNIEVDGTPATRFGDKNNADHYSGLWEHTDIYENVDVSVLTWIERKSEVTTIATFDDDNKPIWMQVETCTSTTCYNRPSEGYFDGYRQNNVGKTVGFVHTGYNPLAAKPENHDFNPDVGAVTLQRKGLFGRCYSNGSDNNRFKQGNFWLTLDSPTVLSYSNDYNRNVTNFGSQGDCTGTNTIDLIKKASLHDIRFFINGNDENVTTCDPNDPNGPGECVVKFTWYTDDFFPSIEPYYSLNGSSYQKLSQICPGVPLDNFVVTQFECTIAQAGNYTFQLHKDDYVITSNTEVIAESQEMTIQSCTSSICDIGVGAPASPPQTVTQFGPMSAHPDNDLIGTTSGSFDIDESGNANYSIPIFAPTGAGGLAPQMALSYSSASGNGIAGVGWNISGTSSITRCLTSPEHDPSQTFYPAITMTDVDALCIDGQRMFKDGTGNYRTEIDSFNKIMPIASNATGPTSFIVYTKSGEIREYGSSDALYKGSMFANGTGAQIITNDGSGAIHTWLLNKIEDRNGNKMHFVWDTFDGENYLAQVKWTMPSSGKNHYQIDFNYTEPPLGELTARSDAMHHYGIGTEYKAYRNLDYIKTSIRQTPTSTGMQEVRRLKLSYEPPDDPNSNPPINNNPTGLLRLASIEQCLNGTGTCLQPVEFEWDNGSTQIGLSSAGGSSADIGEMIEMGYGSYKPIDINGDGQMELIFVRGYDDGFFIIGGLEARYWVAYHTDNGQAPVGVSGCNLVGGYYNYVCDMGIEPFDAESNIADKFNGEKWFVLDYNGDGFQDILSPIYRFPGNNNNDHWIVFLSNGDKICAWSTSNDCSNYAPIDTGIKFYNRNAGSTLLDYTADGLPDLLTIAEDSSTGTNLYKYKLYPMVKSGSSYYFANDSYHAKFVDIDTRFLHPIDMICTEMPDGTGIPCMYNFDDGGSFGRIFANKLEPVTTDFNGDGYNDAIYSYTYRYSDSTCGLGTWPPLVLLQKTSSMPLNEYSTEEMDNATRLINELPQPVQHCQQKFKVIMLTSKNSDGSLKFSYGGRLGIVKNNFNEYNPPVIRCDEGDENECRGTIDSNIGSMQVIDINGDGLADFKYLTTYGDFKYRLNNGQTTTIFVGAVIVGGEIIQEAYQYEVPVFSDSYNIRLPVLSARCATHSSNASLITNDSCGRRLLTQFLDYDKDGDMDILYPDLVANSTTTTVKYLLKKFNSQTNTFESHNIPEANQIVSYNPENLAKDYSNSIFDLNGDGNYDFFSLYRKDASNKSKLVKLGANGYKPKNKITKITNIVDNKQTSIEITYKSATDPTVYTKNTGSFAEDYGQGSPVFDILAPMYLVESVTKNADGYAPTIVAYNYEGLKVQGGGRGSLGFAKVTSIDPHHDMTTITKYRQDFPYIGMPISTETYYGDVQTSNLVSKSYSFYDAKTSAVNGHTTYFPYLKRSFERNYALNTTNTTASGLVKGAATKAIITEFGYGNSTYPAYGNLTTSDVYTCSGSTTMPAITASVDTVCSQANNKLITQKTTSNAYEPENTADWILARLSATNVTSVRKVSAGNYDSKTKSSDFSYYATTGQLKQEHVTGGVKIIHEYDSYGQEIKTYQCTSDIINCQSVPITARQVSASTIHRYKETVYGDGTILWPEYAYASKEPFVSGLAIDIFSQSTANDTLTGGDVNLRITSTIDAFDIYGNPTQASDIFGNYVRTAYGNMGEAHATASNTGSLSTTTKKWCSQAGSYCPTNASISIVTDTLGAPTSRKYLDVMGREVRSQTRMLKGKWSTVDTYYDALGRTFKQSEPYVRNANNTLGTTQTYTTTTFDDLDRVKEIVSPQRCIESANSSGTCTSANIKDIITLTSYTDLAVTTINPKGQTKTQYFDETGKVIESVDSAGDSVLYTYDAHDNLKVTTSYDINNNPINITMSYDNFGRKTSMQDPDKGNWCYIYNELGEMLSQTSQVTNLSICAGKETKYYYDIRGRKYLQTADDVRSIWEYDVGTNYGLLVNEFSIGRGTQALETYPSDGVAQIKNYYYVDDYHRPTSTEITVYDGEGDNTPYNYTTSQTYDAQGRIFQSFDATDNGVLFQYNNYGYQTIIRDAADGTLGRKYHEVLNTDARGQVLYEKFYNEFYTSKTYENSTGFVQTIVTTNDQGAEVQNQSFAYDEVGNLIRRTDETPNNGVTNDILIENFAYDNRNRLLVEYLNDFTSKSYQYDKTGNILDVNGQSYLYAQTGNAGPHAVTSAKGNTYQYDIGGNVIHKTSATTISDFYYTSFDKPYKITAGDWTSEIIYNANNSRYIRKDIKVSDRTVTHYLGSVEYIYKINGPKKAKRYIGNLIIDIIDDEINHTSWGYQYLLKDHIGSTHKVVNKQGNPITAMSFDAWGARRKSTTPDRYQTPIYKTYDLFGSAGVWARLGTSIKNTTNRGFTGHEHFDQVGIIHMNGRIYDPEIGRFLQADPMIQDPYDTQSLNRYSYVMNNPLSYTDPSGYFRLRKGWLLQWYKFTTAIGISIAMPGSQAIFGSMINTMFSSFVSGMVSAGITTGTLKGSLKGGIQAAVTFGIGHGLKAGKGWEGIGAEGSISRAIAHGVVGGISAELDGGKFGHGFASSVLTSGADKLGLKNLDHALSRIIANAIVAGTISEATGGKFANGAMSAAFRVAFNDSINSPRGRKLWDKAHGITVTSSVDGDKHEYGVRGLICSVSTSGCNESYADEVYDYVNRNDIPFTDDDLRTGKHILKPISWLPFGGDPIFHEQNTATRTSVNITLKGHRFHPGTVSHKVQFENGKLYYDLLGDGQGSTPSFNNDIGIYLFKPGVVRAVEKFRLD